MVDKEISETEITGMPAVRLPDERANQASEIQQKQ